MQQDENFAQDYEQDRATEDFAQMIQHEILAPEPLDVGYYVPSFKFLEINEHRAVMLRDERDELGHELIAITGPAHDAKSLRHAQLFAGAPALANVVFEQGGGFDNLVNFGRLCFCVDLLVDSMPREDGGHTPECTELAKAWFNCFPHWKSAITPSMVNDICIANLEDYYEPE